MVDQKKDSNNSSSDAREAIELLYLGYRAFTRGPDRILGKRGLNRAHHRILYFVGRSPQLSISDLLEALCISKQALHEPLRQLVSMNLITRAKSVTDARVKQLELTSTGRRLEARLTGAQIKQLEAVFENTGADAEDAWREVMRELANA